MVSSQRTENNSQWGFGTFKNKRKEVLSQKKSNFWGYESSFGTDGWICKKKRPKPKSAEGRVWPGRANGRNVGGVFTPRGHITIENDRESPPQS